MKYLQKIRLREVQEALAKAEECAMSRKAVQKLRWMEFYLVHGGNASLVARHFGIARSTFLRWAKRFDPQDPSLLEEKFRGPRSVRQPETPPRVVALIEQYRRREPRLSKERIARKLSEEHGIWISPATVGRVVRRNRFFFAEIPSHDRKRKSAATAHIYVGPILVATFVIAFLTVLPFQSAFAAESTSYRLYAGHPGDAEGGPKTGASFRLDGGTMTWKRSPLVSTSYQLVSGVPVAASSASSTPSAESFSSAGGGGRRGVTRGVEEGMAGLRLPKPLLPSAPDEPLSFPALEIPKERMEGLFPDVALPEEIPLYSFMEDVALPSVPPLPPSAAFNAFSRGAGETGGAGSSGGGRAVPVRRFPPEERGRVKTRMATDASRMAAPAVVRERVTTWPLSLPPLGRQVIVTVGLVLFGTALALFTRMQRYLGARDLLRGLRLPAIATKFPLPVLLVRKKPRKFLTRDLYPTYVPRSQFPRKKQR